MWNETKVIPDPTNDQVSKYVFERPDAVAEAVLYKYPDYKTRTVICCSTQSGCPVGCRFCGAGDAFVRSLTADEIVSQPVRLLEDVFAAEGVTPDDMGRCQIMFMSMGEPLLNLKGLIPAMRELYERYPTAALLISTSAPRVDYAPLYAACREIPTVGLQFSVHESTDEERNLLIPFKKKLSLDEIATEGRAFFTETGRHPFFNYCAHDANTSEKNADEILARFDPKIFCATVSVICERNEGHASSNDHQRKLALDFGDKLLARGFDVRVFDPAGQDTIGGGCGQLHFVQQWFGQHPDQVRPTVGTGLPQVKVPA